MKRRLEPRRRSVYGLAALGAFVTLAIIALPEVSFRASLDGLRVFWDVVFPALLPFFIASEVLMGLGVVHFIGALLEPFMRPVFNVPGVGAFAFAMGLASGYPIGARITSRLRREGLCSQVEAERLVSFTNTADPLFMVGAVAVGMFHTPALGPVIAAAHYISAVLVGLTLRFYGRDCSSDRDDQYYRRESILARAAHELYTARKQDSRSFGQIFGDSVRESVNTLLLIGGCIMMFSVIVRVLGVFRVTDLIAAPISAALTPLGISKELVHPMVSGVFEITIGSELASRAAAPLAQRLVIASAVIAWSGLSVFAQVASMLFGTDVRLAPYFFARILHAILAGAVAIVLWETGPWASHAMAVPPQAGVWTVPGFFGTFWASCANLAGALGVTLIPAALAALVHRPRVSGFRVRN
ncbi:MAG: sporulation integral membrane protein YlbJ [Firmicutes bacterium]|jgi:sporulation integral membrane protein YlbJ|nr:sporulation integral membrane protein YlbJ [Bacillota bacterium]